MSDEARLREELATAKAALLKLLIAATRNAGARATVEAVQTAKALVPVTCEHCPEHPHPLDDDETPCKFPRPAPDKPWVDRQGQAELAAAEKAKP